ISIKENVVKFLSQDE
ncbi:hypothetical protein TNCT_265481, partial [Trichonephila clavata]